MEIERVKMKKNLEILESEKKVTKAGKDFMRFKTSDGWMSCFNSVAFKELEKNVGKSVAVDIIESVINEGEENERIFKNITKFYESVEDGKVDAPVVKMSSNTGNRNTTMYVSYVKDLIVAGKTPDEAVRIVKAIRKEF